MSESRKKIHSQSGVVSTCFIALLRLGPGPPLPSTTVMIVPGGSSRLSRARTHNVQTHSPAGTITAPGPGESAISMSASAIRRRVQSEGSGHGPHFRGRQSARIHSTSCPLAGQRGRQNPSASPATWLLPSRRDSLLSLFVLRYKRKNDPAPPRGGIGSSWTICASMSLAAVFRADHLRCTKSS